MTERHFTTPLPIIAAVSSTVVRTIDRLVGDRFRCPLLVSFAVVECLDYLGIKADAYYGRAAWVEVLKDHRLAWVGAWDEDQPHFWVQTQSGEIIDLNLSASSRDRSNGALYSPPMIWSSRLPKFVRYSPLGVAEFAAPAPDREEEKPAFLALEEIRRLIREMPIAENLEDGAGFADEPILVSDQRVLDDSRGTFRAFDRAVSAGNLEPPPTFS